APASGLRFESRSVPAAKPLDCTSNAGADLDSFIQSQVSFVERNATLPAGGTAMSYLSLLFASKASGASPAVREIQNLKPDLRMEDGDFYSPSQWGRASKHCLRGSRRWNTGWIS